jgi:hypothetical protein
MARDENIVHLDAGTSRAAQTHGVPVIRDPVVALGNEEHQVFWCGARLKG